MLPRLPEAAMVTRRHLLRIGIGGLATLTGPPRAQAQPGARVAQAGSGDAVEAWRRYTDCQLSQQYVPCFDHISTDARRRWAEQGWSTAAQYAERKAAEQIWFRRFRLIDMKIDGARAVLTARVAGGGEQGAWVERLEYLLVHEDGGWKIDAIRERTTLYLP